MAVKAKAETKANPQKVGSEPIAEPRKEARFSVEKLRENSIALFNVSTSTFDGAMYGHKESEYSIDEAKQIINKFLNGGKE